MYRGHGRCINPSKVTIGVTPWNPFQTSPQNQASQTPLVQPFDPEQTYGFDLEFDATDGMGVDHPVYSNCLESR